MLRQPCLLGFLRTLSDSSCTSRRVAQTQQQRSPTSPRRCKSADRHPLAWPRPQLNAMFKPSQVSCVHIYLAVAGEGLELKLLQAANGLILQTPETYPLESKMRPPPYSLLLRQVLGGGKPSFAKIAQGSLDWRRENLASTFHDFHHWSGLQACRSPPDCRPPSWASSSAARHASRLPFILYATNPRCLPN